MRIIGPQPISGKVGTSAIADDAVTEAKVANDAISITEMKAGTDGNIISYDASGDPVAIATGNDGQVLTSTGAGSPPAFETLPSGGVETFIATNSPSGAATSAFTTGFGAYNYIDFTFINMQGSSASVNLQMETSTDGGSSYRSSAYRYGGLYQTEGSGGFGTVPSSGSGSKILMMRAELDNDPTTEPGIEGKVRIFDPSSSNQHQGL